MASQLRACLWLLATITVAYLSIPPANAQTGTVPTAVSFETVGTTTHEITNPTTVNGMTTATSEVTTVSISASTMASGPTEALGISPTSSNPQLSTLEMASQNVGDNATSRDTSSSATQDNIVTELSTLEVVSPESGSMTTTGDISSTAKPTERVPPEPEATTECEDCNPTTKAPEEPGLSPGEIAGIVIGSVAGVAIIGGGIGFAIYHFNAPTKVTPTTDIEIQDMSDSPEANTDRAKLTNASDTHTDGDA